MRKITTILQIMAVTTVLAIASNASASHFRYGHIFWKQVGNNTVEATVQAAWRRNGYVCWDASTLTVTACSSDDGLPGVGDVFLENIGGTTLNWGDGTIASSPLGRLLFVVTSIDTDNNWLFAEALDATSLPAIDTTLSHTYATPGDYTAFIGSCCRISAISSPNEHINNPDGAYQVQTIINAGTTNNSPISVSSPIVTCPINGLCQFSIPASDPDADPLTFRLSTSSEAGSGFSQPPGATVDSTSGVYSWDTTGAQLASNPANNTLYSTQVTIEDATSKVALDFFIQLVDDVDPNPPQITPSPNSPPICNTTQVVNLGDTKSFDVLASDVDPGDMITLNVVGLPDGATMQPQLPVTDNPVSSIFSWMPTSSDLGDHVMNFTAASTGGGSADCPVTVRVTDPCDIDADDDIDVDDVNLIFSARNTPSSGPNDPRDADGDGVITVLDGRICALKCTLENCATPE